MESTSKFIPEWFRWYTLGVIILILGLGFVTIFSGLWNFLLLGIGEMILYAIYQRKWKRYKPGNDLATGQMADQSSFSFGRYVFLTWVYAMIMEFCVDFGSYGTINLGVVLLIMVGLTPHYFFLAVVFRLWFRWYTFSPREAYFTMGTVGFLLESIILKVFAGTFQLSGILLFPIDIPVHMLNYGGIVLIPTLLHNRSDNRQPMKTKMKYLVTILGTLALTLPEIALTYWFVYQVVLK